MSVGAATANTNLPISVSVNANCAVTASSVNFGVYDPLAAAPTTASGALTITCTQGTAPVLTVGLGLNELGSVRRLSSGSAFIPYSLLQPTSNAPGASCAGASVAFPSAAPGFALTAAPSIASRSYNVCAQIAPGQDVSVGSYTDTVVVTVTF
ncbi:MAG: spore coat protein U domain-containing protein [Burkholderiales bacterium]